VILPLRVKLLTGLSANESRRLVELKRNIWALREEEIRRKKDLRRSGGMVRGLFLCIEL
jgi:hypothetical protein